MLQNGLHMYVWSLRQSPTAFYAWQWQNIMSAVQAISRKLGNTTITREVRRRATRGPQCSEIQTSISYLSEYISRGGWTCYNVLFLLFIFLYFYSCTAPLWLVKVIADLSSLSLLRNTIYINCALCIWDVNFSWIIWTLHSSFSSIVTIWPWYVPF